MNIQVILQNFCIFTKQLYKCKNLQIPNYISIFFSNFGNINSFFLTLKINCIIILFKVFKHLFFRHISIYLK